MWFVWKEMRILSASDEEAFAISNLQAPEQDRRL